MSGRRVVSFWLIFLVWALVAVMLALAVHGAIEALTLLLSVIA